MTYNMFMDGNTMVTLSVVPKRLRDTGASWPVVDPVFRHGGDVISVAVALWTVISCCV